MRFVSINNLRYKHAEHLFIKVLLENQETIPCLMIFFLPVCTTDIPINIQQLV